MSPILARFALIWLVATALPAQTTHHVSGSKLQAAINAAKAGDILIVTGVSWSPVVIDKPLFIYGQQSGFWLTQGSVSIRNIPKGASLTLSGFQCSVPSFTVSGCQGHVLLSRLSGTGPEISACSDVAIAGCALGLTTVKDSKVTVSESTIRGQRHSTRFPHYPGTPAMVVSNSTMAIWDASIQGGWHLGDLPAIQLAKSSLWVNQSTIANLKLSGQTPAITGTGTLTYDPSVVFDVIASAGPIASTVNATRRPLPLFTMPQSPIGGQATASFHASAGTVYGMFVGTPGAPITIPGITGVFEVATPILVRVGTLPSTGLASLSFTVPSMTTLRGRMFRWQGITVQGQTAEWSNAVMESHY